MLELRDELVLGLPASGHDDVGRGRLGDLLAGDVRVPGGRPAEGGGSARGR